MLEVRCDVWLGLTPYYFLALPSFLFLFFFSRFSRSKAQYLHLHRFRLSWILSNGTAARGRKRGTVERDTVYGAIDSSNHPSRRVALVSLLPVVFFVAFFPSSPCLLFFLSLCVTFCVFSSHKTGRVSVAFHSYERLS